MPEKKGILDWLKLMISSRNISKIDVTQTFHICMSNDRYQWLEFWIETPNNKLTKFGGLVYMQE